MGSICGINVPERWKVIQEGLLKNDGRPVVEIEIGSYDDYPSGGVVCCYMFKEHYDKIISKQIDIVRHSYSDTEPIELFENGKKISPFRQAKTFVY